MTEEISTKNTKNEILEAYFEVLEKLKETKTESRFEQKILEENKEILSVVSLQTSDEIVKNLAELKLSLVKSVEEIEGKLLSSYKNFSNLQKAVGIQTKELNDLYEIKVTADTLAALLIAQKEKNLSFEKEMHEKQQSLEQEIIQKRLFWKKEQDDFEMNRKEQESQIKKIRQREEEEYIYKRDLSRQKDRDQYTAEKSALEKELLIKRIDFEKEFEIRENKIVAHEQEFNSMKDKIEKFSLELQKIILETETSVTDKLKFKYDYEAKLTQKEVDGERKLFEQMIAGLEAKVKHLEIQTRELTEKTSQANLQVQDIAVKAIDGASRQRYVVGNYLERPAEQKSN